MTKLCLLSTLIVLLWAQSATAQEAEESELVEESGDSTSAEDDDQETWNAIGVRAAITIALKDEESGSGRGTEILGGFIVSYERTLIPELFALELAAPVLFGDNTVELPFDVTFKLLWRTGDWEQCLGLGMSLSPRFPQTEEDGEYRIYLGGTATVGTVYYIDNNIGFEMAFDVSVYPADERTFEMTVNAGFVHPF